MEQQNKFPFGALFIVLATIIYVFSPIDIVPDLFLGLGQLDDLGVIVFGVMAGNRIYNYFKNKKSGVSSPNDVIVDVESKDVQDDIEQENNQDIQQ